MKKTKLSALNRLITILICSIGLIFYLFFVDPSGGGLVTILIPILIAWIIIFTSLNMILENIVRTKRSVTRFTSAIITSSVLFFMLLSGIGTISIVDILLTTSLVIIAGFYVARLWK